MSNLQELQRRVAAVVMQPLTPQEGMRRRTLDGRSIKAESETLIKPNRVLSSFERLEIYNRQYWFRVLSSLAEDFSGLRTVIGARGWRPRSSRCTSSGEASSSWPVRRLG